MIDYDFVDFFVGPYYSLSVPASNDGENLGKLVLLVEFPADSAFNNAIKHYTLSFTPSLAHFSTDCLVEAQTVLRSKGLTTNMTVYVAYTLFSYCPGIEALQFIPTLGMNLVGSIYYDPTVMTWDQIALNISYYKKKNSSYISRWSW